MKKQNTLYWRAWFIIGLNATLIAAIWWALATGYGPGLVFFALAVFMVYAGDKAGMI